MNRRDKTRCAGVSRRDAGDARVWRGMCGAYLGVHVRHEPGADLAGLSLADIHLLHVQLVRLLVLVRLDHLADARVDELLDALGGLGGLVGHRAHGDARSGRACGAARRRAQGRGRGEGVHGAEGESHRGCRWRVPRQVSRHCLVRLRKDGRRSRVNSARVASRKTTFTTSRIRAVF